MVAAGDFMAGLIRRGTFLGRQVALAAQTHGLTLDELSADACRSTWRAPSGAYLKHVETGKRMPSAQMLQRLQHIRQGFTLVPRRKHRGGVAPHSASGGGLERCRWNRPSCSPHELLQNALPELLSRREPPDAICAIADSVCRKRVTQFPGHRAGRRGCAAARCP